jgi:hypothetical protein
MTEQAHSADHLPTDGPAFEPPTNGITSGDRPDQTAGPREIGGRAGPEPTRYGDWEMRGRCIDF